MSLIIPYSDACERNKDVIWDAMQPYIQSVTSVLEIGSGTGQHAVYFAQQAAHLKWQTTDQQQYLSGIKAQLENAGGENVLQPYLLDVNQCQWTPNEEKYDCIYTANTFHIMAWEDVQAFFKGVSQVTQKGSYLIVYGPFKYGGKFTSASNEHFDHALRARASGSAIREFEEINNLALKADFKLLRDTSMPANNQCIVWQKTN